jgi:NDP-sugar pyrophosphorylase family protein
LKAALLVGGAGTRLRPLTYVVPKCLLPVGGKPLLERTITYLQGYGVTDFVLCVAYLKKQIIDMFGDGSSRGVRIEYAQSETPLGTAGQLKTASRFLDETFIAMNGDIVTNMNVDKLLSSHGQSGAVATIALKEFGVKIPYGHVEVGDNGRVASFKEKPTLNFMANAGIYAIEPRVLEGIPAEKVYSLETEVFPKLLAAGEKVGTYYESAYWADVGSMADFERVNNEAMSDPSIVIPPRPDSDD